MPASLHPPLGGGGKPAHARPHRARALHVRGFGLPDPKHEHRFRLPCPPTWDDRPPGGQALQRRVRKAYFAVLDSMRTGRAEPALDTRLQMLLAESRSRTANAALRQLLRAVAAVQRAGGTPLLEAPPAPLTAVAVTVPPFPAARPGAPRQHPTDALMRRYAWALEWLRLHRFTAGKRLEIEWRQDPALM